MISRFSTINCAIILLAGHLILGSSASGLHEIITVTIKNGDENIVLNWKRTEGYLANFNLPIWSVLLDRDPILMPNVMEDVGPFAMYHDVEKSSAVVYFAELKRFFGIVDTRFYIGGLPLSEITPNTHHEVNGLYVKLRGHGPSGSFHDDVEESTMAIDVPQIDDTYINSVIDDMITSGSQYSANAIPSDVAHRANEVLYAEVLVFITYDIVLHYSTGGRNLKSLVAYYLVHFNAIDMLFAKLASNGIGIRINIAGLVLEAQNMAFSVENSYRPGDNPALHNIDAVNTLHGFVTNLKKHKNIFVEDSFDMFFLSTGYKIQLNKAELKGIAISQLNVYDIRRAGAYDPLGVLVQNQPFYTDYISSAHEIAHVMNVGHDSIFNGLYCNGAQCFAILQQYGSYCRNCIKWSENSIKDLQAYVSSSLNHCFLLNAPRSLHPYGKPIQTLTPHQQCVCYGYQSHIGPVDYLDAVGLNDCNKILQCADENESHQFSTLYPVDGTPCDLNKVCWQRQCVDLRQPQMRQVKPRTVRVRQCQLQKIGNEHLGKN